MKEPDGRSKYSEYTNLLPESNAQCFNLTHAPIYDLWGTHYQSKKETSHVTHAVSFDVPPLSVSYEKYTWHRKLMATEYRLRKKVVESAAKKKDLKKQWKELEDMEISLNESFKLYNQFIINNKVKRERAEQKQTELEKQKLNRIKDIKWLKEKLEKMYKVKDTMKEQIQAYSIYEKFLNELTVQGEFKSVISILNRFDALMNVKYQTAQIFERVTQEFHNWTEAYSNLVSKCFYEILELSRLVSYWETRFDAVRHETYFWENILNEIVTRSLDIFKNVGGVKHAIRHIYTYLSHRQKYTAAKMGASDKDKLMFIKQSLGEVAKMNNALRKIVEPTKGDGFESPKSVESERDEDYPAEIVLSQFLQRLQEQKAAKGQVHMAALAKIHQLFQKVREKGLEKKEGVKEEKEKPPETKDLTKIYGKPMSEKQSLMYRIKLAMLMKEKRQTETAFKKYIRPQRHPPDANLLPAIKSLFKPIRTPDFRENYLPSQILADEERRKDNQEVNESVAAGKKVVNLRSLLKEAKQNMEDTDKDDSDVSLLGTMFTSGGQSGPSTTDTSKRRATMWGPTRLPSIDSSNHQLHAVPSNLVTMMQSVQGFTLPIIQETKSVHSIEAPVNVASKTTIASGKDSSDFDYATRVSEKQELQMSKNKSREQIDMELENKFKQVVISMNEDEIYTSRSSRPRKRKSRASGSSSSNAGRSSYLPPITKQIQK